jgi:hypothetical protein
VKRKRQLKRQGEVRVPRRRTGEKKATGLKKGTGEKKGTGKKKGTGESSVADPDPGSGAFLTPGPGSGIGFCRIPDLGSRILTPYFLELSDKFLGKSSTIL